MIIVRLMGGLGNQMFQYAAGRRLAHIHNVHLKLDLSWFNNIENVNTARRYELHVFNIIADTASPEEVALLKRDKMSVFPEGIKKFINAINLFKVSTWIREKHYHFDPAILKLTDNVYLEGYWQSEKYFKDIEAIIRKEFTIKEPLSGKNKEMAELIRSSAAVSIHIRRGDYVTNPSTNQFHGVCGLDYYSNCIEKIAGMIKKPHFFVFSDEPEWAQNNLKLHYPTKIIAHNAAGMAYEDLRLMSQCRHHIIANSSFSWWGAWLNPDPDKKVFAPKRWFKTNEYNDADLIPKSWLRV